MTVFIINKFAFFIFGRFLGDTLFKKNTKTDVLNCKFTYKTEIEQGQIYCSKEFTDLNPFIVPEFPFVCLLVAYF